MNGIEAIAAERQRQIEKEGWTPEHDDQYDDQQLAYAAAWYAIPMFTRNVVAGCMKGFKPIWPWDACWLKSDARRRKRDIEKAGALLASEWDRLDRAEKKRVAEWQKIIDEREKAKLSGDNQQ